MKAHQIAHYRSVLKDLAGVLRTFEVNEWPEIIDRWLAELERIEPGDSGRLLAHAARSQRATGGMGSIGDIFVTPQAGHAISSDADSIAEANRRLKELVHQLYVVAKAIQEEC